MAILRWKSAARTRSERLGRGPRIAKYARSLACALSVIGSATSSNLESCHQGGWMAEECS